MNKGTSLFTHDIKKQLRAIHANLTPRTNRSHATDGSTENLPVVVSTRSTGKTTGLMQFVGERLLTLDENQNVVVVVPNEEIGREFLRKFKDFFPLLREPLIVPSGTAIMRLCGRNVKEVYIEEVLLLSDRDLHDVCKNLTVVAGVGTIERPVTTTLNILTKQTN